MYMEKFKCVYQNYFNQRHQNIHSFQTETTYYTNGGDCTYMMNSLTLIPHPEAALDK